MPLPTLELTWQINSNILQGGGLSSQAAAAAAVNYSVKTTLTGFATLPWVVVMSDGAVSGYSATGDAWLSVADVAAANKWCVFERTDGLQLLLSVTTGVNVTLTVSPGGLFTGGGVGTKPTATDQQVIRNNTSWLSNNAANYNQYMHAWHSTDGLHTRLIVTRNGASVGFLFMENVEDTSGGLWTNPWICSAYGYYAYTEQTLWADLYTVDSWTYANVGGTACQLFFTAECTGGTPVVLSVTIDDLTGEWPFGQIGLFSDQVGTIGKRGRIKDMWWGATVPATGDTYPAAGKTFAQFGDLILPWDGSTVLMTGT